jgi:hypothetical protein
MSILLISSHGVDQRSTGFDGRLVRREPALGFL